MQQKICAAPHNNLNSLKSDLHKAWEEIDEDMLQQIMNEFPKRLKDCSRARGGYIEKKLFVFL